MTHQRIIKGDCLDIMKSMPDNHIDACITDPPYGISFMGKKWDYDVPSVEIWKECLRVLKPGGYLLAFAGTRTQHRMAVRIEDAGFEIRDMIAWVYGSGFPKSLNIGKAIKALNETGGSSPRNLRKTRMGEDYKPTGQEDYRKGRMFSSEIENDNTKEIIDNEWEGWGTALKPALEPITVARKPLEGTVAENCLKWGVGGINIDESRVEAATGDKFGGGGLNSPVNGFMGNTENTYKKGTGFRDDTALGRFPANLIHDNSEEVRECFPETGKSTGGRIGNKGSALNMMGQDFEAGDPGYGDSGNASRFFKSIIYQAKASKSERNNGCEGLEEKDKAGKYFRPNHTVKAELGEDGNPFGRWGKIKNNHPTVKPIALMEYLVKLVSRERAIVLDPFAGSGSTLIACRNLGRNSIGIEKEEEYCEIARKRLNKPNAITPI